MQFFVYFTVSPDKPMSPPSPEGMAAMGKFMKESMDSGMVVATGRLGTQTTLVKLEDDEITVTDGPFIEGKELIPGFTVIEVESREAAVEWTTKLRRCMGSGTLRLVSVTV